MFISISTCTYNNIILVLGNCGRLKGLVDKVMAEQQEFTVHHVPDLHMYVRT